MLPVSTFVQALASFVATGCCVLLANPKLCKYLQFCSRIHSNDNKKVNFWLTLQAWAPFPTDSLAWPRIHIPFLLHRPRRRAVTMCHRQRATPAWSNNNYDIRMHQHRLQQQPTLVYVSTSSHRRDTIRWWRRTCPTRSRQLIWHLYRLAFS